MCVGCTLHDWLRRIYARTEDLATVCLTDGCNRQMTWT